MIVSVLISLVLIVLAITFHYWALGMLVNMLPEECGPNRHFAHAVGVLLLVTSIHLAIILVFASAMWCASQYLDLGSLGSLGPFSFMDYFYHSSVSYSTLGLSEVPEGHLKIMTALESLTGILLLTWSATFYYSVMGRNPKSRS